MRPKIDKADKKNRGIRGCTRTYLMILTKIYLKFNFFNVQLELQSEWGGIIGKKGKM